MSFCLLFGAGVILRNESLVLTAKTRPGLSFLKMGLFLVRLRQTTETEARY
jgi:hypothetical protein